MQTDGRQYLASHEWCLLSDGIAQIGVTSVGLAQMAVPVFLDLPAAGTAVAAGRPFAEFETARGVFDLISPVSGEVLEVNHALVERLDELAADPLTASWMIRVRFESAAPELLDAAAYQRHCDTSP